MCDMTALAEKWLLEYFATFGERTPSQLEDDLCGEPNMAELWRDGPLYQWRRSPFYPALKKFVASGVVVFRQDDDETCHYKLKVGE